MTTVLPAVLAALAVTLALGLPAPRRPGLLPAPPRAAREVTDLVTGAVALGALFAPLGPVGALVGAVLAVLGRRALRARAATGVRRAERAAAAEAMAVLAAELRAGRSPAAALTSASQVATGPTARALAEAGGSARMGAAAHEVLASQASACAVPELLQGLSVCWEVCQGSGSSLALAVDRLEEALRAEAVLRDELDEELAGPKATALVISFMPLVALLLGFGMGGDPVRVLLHTPVGWGCLVGGIALELAGTAWTAAIVRAAGGAA